MNGHHLTLKPNDNVRKGPPGPLREKIVTLQRLHCEKLVLNNTEQKHAEKFSHSKTETNPDLKGKRVNQNIDPKNGFKKKNNVRKTSDTSASKVKKAKVSMMKKFVAKIGNNDLNVDKDRKSSQNSTKSPNSGESIKIVSKPKMKTKVISNITAPFVTVSNINNTISSMEVVVTPFTLFTQGF